MSLENAVKFAKRANEEKMGYRFQFPISLKEEFEIVCQENGVSMTDMILGLISSSVDEHKGISNSTTLSIVNKIEDLSLKLDDLHMLHNKVGQDTLMMQDGSELYIVDDMDTLNIQLKALKRELINRS